jgi:hypothetical protein
VLIGEKTPPRIDFLKKDRKSLNENTSHPSSLLHCHAHPWLVVFDVIVP